MWLHHFCPPDDTLRPDGQLWDLKPLNWPVLVLAGIISGCSLSKQVPALTFLVAPYIYLQSLTGQSAQQETFFP